MSAVDYWVNDELVVVWVFARMQRSTRRMANIRSRGSVLPALIFTDVLA